jgi:glutathione peroxidase
MREPVKKRLRFRRRVLQSIYPALIKAGKIFGLKARTEVNIERVSPAEPFYSLKMIANNGIEFDFERFKGKKVLIVNTASNCGYTPQLSELKWLQELYKGRLEVVGFPSGDFREQELGSDVEIANFCHGTFGIRFPLMKKSVVAKTPEQNKVFQWLTRKEKNGWNEREPEWNFSKYLVNEHGVLTHYFGPGISPVSKRVTRAVNLGAR